MDLFERPSLTYLTSSLFRNTPPYFSFGFQCNEQENFLCPVGGAEAGFKSTEGKRNIATSITHSMPHTKHHVLNVLSGIYVYFVIHRMTLLKFYNLFIN